MRIFLHYRPRRYACHHVAVDGRGIVMRTAALCIANGPHSGLGIVDKVRGPGKALLATLLVLSVAMLNGTIKSEICITSSFLKGRLVTFDGGQWIWMRG